MGNTVRHRVHRIALDQGVTLDIKGLYEPDRKQLNPTNQPRGVNGTTAVGQDGVGVVAVQAQSIPEARAHAYLDETSRYADVLSLLSLAANERLRSLLDDAYTLARGRRYGSHGIVPPDLQDLAIGEDRRAASVKSESITGTSWDQPHERPGEASSVKGMSSYRISLMLHKLNIIIRIGG